MGERKYLVAGNSKALDASAMRWYNCLHWYAKDSMHAERMRRSIMPRGRRRAPQESIDSILLALCRRNDIDPDTLSHYFDRLDEEWTEGAREKVLGLLRNHDPSVYAA